LKIEVFILWQVLVEDFLLSLYAQKIRQVLCRFWAS